MMQKKALYGSDENLELLASEFRRTGQARRGYALLRSLIRAGERKKLNKLLRDHKKKGVYKEEELSARDDVDFLIGFYSLVAVGSIAGRIDQALPERFRKEVEMILGDPSVRRYYTEHYPLLLPDLLYQLVTGQIAQLPRPGLGLRIKPVEAGVRFDEFLMLVRAIKNDPEVEVFLGMLDDYLYDDKGLSHLIKLLGDEERLRKVVRRRRQATNLDKAAMGCVRYLRLLQEYHELLNRTGSDDQLAAAMWHYQGYWFKHMRKQFNLQLGKILRNIGRSVEAVTRPSSSSTVWYDSPTEPLEKGARDSLEQMAVSVKALIDPRWGAPLVAWAQREVSVKR